MSDGKRTAAFEKPYDAITLAKKHRISIDDAKLILEEYGEDRKLADKAARRIAA